MVCSIAWPCGNLTDRLLNRNPAPLRLCSKEHQEDFVFRLYNRGQFRTLGECYRNVSAVELTRDNASTTTFKQRFGRRQLEIRLEPESTVGSRKVAYSSSDDDLDREIVSIGHSVGERDVATFGVLDIVRRQLRLPLFLPVAVLVGVVLRRDDDTSLVGSEVRDNITPTLVVVDAQRDDEVFAGVGRETKGAARSATTHGEHIGSVGLAPRSAVGVFPDRLLDDVEKSVLVGLVDLCGDCVAHSRRKNNERTERKRRCVFVR
jgi:hypothetical protein